MKEAVAEAEASLPEIVTVIPAGVDNQRIHEALQSFLGASVMAVSFSVAYTSSFDVSPFFFSANLKEFWRVPVLASKAAQFSIRISRARAYFKRFPLTPR